MPTSVIAGVGTAEDRRAAWNNSNLRFSESQTGFPPNFAPPPNLGVVGAPRVPCPSMFLQAPGAVTGGNGRLPTVERTHADRLVPQLPSYNTTDGASDSFARPGVDHGSNANPRVAVGHSDRFCAWPGNRAMLRPLCEAEGGSVPAPSQFPPSACWGDTGQRGVDFRGFYESIGRAVYSMVCPRPQLGMEENRQMPAAVERRATSAEFTLREPVFDDRYGTSFVGPLLPGDMRMVSSQPLGSAVERANDFDERTSQHAGGSFRNQWMAPLRTDEWPSAAYQWFYPSFPLPSDRQCGAMVRTTYAADVDGRTDPHVGEWTHVGGELRFYVVNLPLSWQLSRSVICELILPRHCFMRCPSAGTTE